MSNRIAASRTTGRVELVAWPPAASRWRHLMAAASGWLRLDAARHPAFASPHIRRDLGLASATGDSLPDFEARRLGF